MQSGASHTRDRSVHTHGCTQQQGRLGDDDALRIRRPWGGSDPGLWKADPAETAAAATQPLRRAGPATP